MAQRLTGKPRVTRVYRRALAIAAIQASVSIAYGSGGQQGGGEPELTFEAATVKPSPADEFLAVIRGGPGTSDPERISYRRLSLKNLLSTAYGVGYDEILGPAWLESLRFDVEATMARGTTREQFRSMLLNLLRARFGLAAHFEPRAVPGYALVVAPSGPTLKDATDGPPSESVGGSSERPDGDRPPVDRDGFTVTPPGPGVKEVCIAAGCRFRATRASMQELADILPCRCPIVDETHLTGKYGFTLTGDVMPLVRPNLEKDQSPPRTGGTFPDIFHALRSQLGLELKAKRVLTRVVVVDHIEKSPIAD